MSVNGSVNRIVIGSGVIFAGTLIGLLFDIISELPAIEMAGILLHSSDYCPQVHKLDPVFHR